MSDRIVVYQRELGALVKPITLERRRVCLFGMSVAVCQKFQDGGLATVHDHGCGVRWVEVTDE